MQILYEKNIIDSENMFKYFITDLNEYPPHWHEEIEVVYALESCLEMGVNNTTYKLFPGDVFIVNPGDIHYFLPGDKPTNRIIMLIKLTIFEELTSEIVNKRIVNPLIKKDINDNIFYNKLQNKILLLQKEMHSKKWGYKFAVKAYIYEIVLLIMRYRKIEELSLKEKTKQLKKIDKLEKVYKYVTKHYNEVITLEDIADVANFSTYYFSRFFKETTGMTFLQYLNNYRITQATQLLIHSSYNITEVSNQCGFESIKTFNRVFKKIKGCSPSDYRKTIFERVNHHNNYKEV
ncbi:MAG: helix-turn-helix domain-containing protein [Eubacteriales bacterium]